MKIPRRKFIIGSAAGISTLALSSYLSFKQKPAVISGGIIGANSSIGHKLHAAGFLEPSKVIEKDVVIVGGGIAGLAAGYNLAKSGQQNFILLDLEKNAGGNSSSGINSVSAYPWGAHYVPLLTQESSKVRQLFEDLGVITGYDSKGLPIYNEYYICSDPQDRLFMYGRWQDGLIPSIGVTPEEEIQYKKFFSFIEDLKNKKGSDGKRIFAIPVDQSSQDKKWLDLDKITISEWMNKNGYTSENLLWYINYCCRDDFGTTADETSAWAGLHYFAARNGKAANTESTSIITWPEGNGWLVNKLKEKIEDKIQTNALAYNVTDHGEYMTVDYWNDETQNTERIKARAVIMATPRFITSRLLKSEFMAKDFTYSPWAVANITLSDMPKGKGALLSWDNVVFNSQLLGYIVATHQITQMKPSETVLTYYWPLTHTNPSNARKEAMSRSYAEWQSTFLKELLHIHSELNGKVKHLDVWVWGHAMIRPIKGFIWGEERRKALMQQAPIFTAHSDMSGISIFEEAYTHGANAAENVLSYLRTSIKKAS